jgi:hypothetical protein
LHAAIAMNAHSASEILIVQPPSTTG